MKGLLGVKYPTQHQTSIQRMMVDTHAHFHRCYDAERFLQAAVANALRIANATPALMLADPRNFNSIELIANQLNTRSSEFSLRTYSANRAAIEVDGDIVGLFIRGHQICTAERLEILAFGQNSTVTDGLDFEQTLQTVARQSSLAIIPWGFGKWWGKRQRTIQMALANASQWPDLQATIALGDNACRPGLFGFFSQLKSAFDVSLKILPGSDPLPFQSEVARIASFGMLVEVEDDYGAETMADNVFRAVAGSDVPTVGSHVSFTRFLKQQICMRVKRARSSR